MERTVNQQSNDLGPNLVSLTRSHPIGDGTGLRQVFIMNKNFFQLLNSHGSHSEIISYPLDLITQFQSNAFHLTPLICSKPPLAVIMPDTVNRSVSVSALQH